MCLFVSGTNRDTQEAILNIIGLYAGFEKPGFPDSSTKLVFKIRKTKPHTMRIWVHQGKDRKWLKQYHWWWIRMPLPQAALNLQKAITEIQFDEERGGVDVSAIQEEADNLIHRLFSGFARNYRLRIW